MRFLAKIGIAVVVVYGALWAGLLCGCERPPSARRAASIRDDEQILEPIPPVTSAIDLSTLPSQ